MLLTTGNALDSTHTAVYPVIPFFKDKVLSLGCASFRVVPHVIRMYVCMSATSFFQSVW